MVFSLKWSTIITGLFTCFIANSINTLGWYQYVLQGELLLSDPDKHVIYAAGTGGIWVLISGGYIYDRYGPKPLMLFGGILGCIGMSRMHYIMKTATDKNNAAYTFFFTGLGCGWILIATMGAVFKHVEEGRRSLASGAIFSFFAASPALFLTLYYGCLGGTVGMYGCVDGVFGSNLAQIFEMLGYLIPCVAFVGLCLMTNGSMPSHSTKRNGYNFYYDLPYIFIYLLTITTLLYNLIVNLNYAYGDDPTIIQWTPKGVIVFLSLFVLIHVFTFFPTDTSATNEASERVYSVNSIESPLIVAEPENHFSPSNLWRSKTFWLLWFAFGVCVGGNNMIVNLVEDSLSHDRGIDIVNWMNVSYATVIIIHTSNAFSSLITGYLLNFFETVPYTIFVILGAIAMILGQLFLIVDSNSMLYVGIVTTGISQGILWVTVPLLVFKLFGRKHFGANFGVFMFGPALFTTILSYIMEPDLYDDQINVNTPPNNWQGDPVYECYGINCYQTSLAITGCVGLVGLSAAFFLNQSESNRARSYENDLEHSPADHI